MARPPKQGLQYFPCDVDIFESDKLFDVQMLARDGVRPNLVPPSHNTGVGESHLPQQDKAGAGGPRLSDLFHK